MRSMRTGVSPDEYEAMLARQGGVCAICGRPEMGRHGTGRKKLAVDHDHRTGATRSLLCSRCNLALGMLLDSPVLVAAALAYLTGWRDGSQSNDLRRVDEVAEDEGMAALEPTAPRD